jgi:phosphoenolpyruvate-protein phosphotransferase (PTS system enzyme I)
MEIRKGIGVSPGVAICTAVVLDAEDLLVPRRQIAAADVPAEIERFNHAVAASLQELTQLRESTAEKHGKEIAAIFDFHLGILRDQTVLNQVIATIEKEITTAEYAVSLAMRRFAGMFAQMSDRFLSERIKDIHDIEKRLLRQLIGGRHESLAHLDHDVVVIAHDLLPSQTAALDKTKVRGFATDVGGRTGHTAIVARAMGIPAVVGLGNLTAEVSAGDLVIIDGNRGVVIINPDEQAIAEHREFLIRLNRLETQMQAVRDLPAVTRDGCAVNILANIEFPEEVDDALNHGAGGIGLYRTEFLFMAAETEPTEDDHYRAYAEALRRLKGRPLVIRTLDLGADKYAKAQQGTPERNPFLGARSIRLCLHDIPMFKRQLRAILRATVLGDVRIMFPMISTIMELRQATMVLRDVMEELEDEGTECRKDIPIGAMIEVPSAALMADHLAREASFFSIGTNDLIQYTLAVDRTNEKVAGLYSPANPAVLLLIRDVIDAAQRNQIACSVCGEMAGEPMYTLLLLGLGLKTFSMNGPDIPEVKTIIRSTTMEHAREVAKQVMSFDSERQVLHYLREETRKILPDAF